MRRTLAIMMVTIAIQQFSVGMVTVSLVQKRFAEAFLFAVVLNLAWWLNVGHRIELHKNYAAGLLYAVTAAASCVLGAWIGWR